MTLLRRLVESERWSYEAFCLHFGRAARETAGEKGEPRIAQVSVSRRSYTRWLTGDLKGLPSREACLVLEHLFDEHVQSAEDLFREPADAPMGGVVEGPAVAGALPDGSAAVDPALVPHWTGMLQILSAAHNAFGPAQIHHSAVQEMAVIRQNRERAGGGLAVGLMSVEARWAEFASWTADTMGDPQRASFWLDQALVLAQHADDRALVSYVLMRQAQGAVERGNAGLAVALAGRAWQSAGHSTRDRALCAVRQAEAHALAGDGRGARRAAAEALRLVGEAERAGAAGDPVAIGLHCVPAYVRAHEAHCLMLLDDHQGALTALEEVLADWPDGLRQDGLLARAWLAECLVRTGRSDEAGAAGQQILTANLGVGSGRVHRALVGLAMLAEHLANRPPELEAFCATVALIPRRM
ncbi:tol-pal system YbgF family protein [Kitasatospora purpeofusca]|uniref:tetratricopeptide repeat protein n=1 Tax=Kitasatospora purpeofusca TaxID=67352 RepID=UPI0035E1A491